MNKHGGSSGLARL